MDEALFVEIKVIYVTKLAPYSELINLEKVIGKLEN